MGGLVKNQEERLARDRGWEDRAKNEVVSLVAAREACLSTGRQQRHQVGIFYNYEKDARYGGFPRWSPPSHGLSRSKGSVPRWASNCSRRLICLNCAPCPW